MQRARRTGTPVKAFKLGTSLLLRCATAMAVEIAKEAANMGYDTTPALHTVYEPRQGQHDDVLIATAMAVWYGQKEAASGWSFR